MTEVIAAGSADLDRLSQVVADAFFDLPPSHWLIADSTARREIFPHYFRILLEHALACGLICTTASRDAVAVWIPVTDRPPDPPPDYRARLQAATFPRTRRFLAFDDALARHHPASPHHHLALLAVDPDRQDRGIGTALLRRHHATLDESGTAAYLEASSQRNRRLYERHGYRLHPDGPFCLPAGGPPMWPMVRQPAPSVAADQHDD